MSGLVIHYDWLSFQNHKIKISDLRKSLKWIECLVNILDPSLHLQVIPFENWWFKIRFENIAENVIGGLVLAWIVWLISFFSHTQGGPYTVDVTNSTWNGDVNIININGNWHTFNQSLLPTIRQDNIRNCLQQICAPLSQSDDYVEIYDSNESSQVWIIKYEDKGFYEKPVWEEKNNFTIRGWIYEINYKQKTFRVQIHEGYSFNVSLLENIEITSISRYADTEAIELSWSIKMSKEGKILSMKLYGFREVQTSLPIK